MTDGFRREMRSLIVAVQFLTRLPSPQLPGFQPEWLQRSVAYFPLVGAFVGAICGAAILAASSLWGGALPAVLAIALGIGITGGLHEDGLADFFDAMGGSSPAARFAIMKDSRLGAYGAMALGIALTLKVLSLAALPAWSAAAALIAAHAGGRLAAVVCMAVMTYAGDVSAAKVRPFGHAIPAGSRATAAIFGLVPLSLLAAPCALVSAIAAAGAAALVALWARRLLGGYTGDVLGAVEQTFEVAFMMAAAACG